MKLNNSSITKIALCETFQTPGQRIKPEVPIKKTLAGRASSLTSPPCPRPLAVLARGAAWESPIQQWGSKGGGLSNTLSLQCWDLPLHLQGQSRLQIHQVNCNVPYKLSRRKTTKAPPGNFYWKNNNLFLSLKSHLSNITGGAYFGHSHRVGAGATWNHGREALAAAREAKMVSSI